MKNAVIIPARGGSKGVPRKNLEIVGGKPLIAYVIETALNTRCVDFVAISTEDEEIATVSKGLGAEIIKRPNELARDEVSLPAVIKHAKLCLEAKGFHPERYISLQPTGPLITTESLGKAIKFHKESKCDSVVSIIEITHGHPYWVKSVDPLTHVVRSFLNVDVLKYPQKQDLPPCYMYTGGFYIRKTELVGGPEGFYLGEDIRGYLVSSEEALDIDTKEDMNYLEFLITKKQNEARDKQ